MPLASVVDAAAALDIVDVGIAMNEDRDAANEEDAAPDAAAAVVEEAPGVQGRGGRQDDAVGPADGACEGFGCCFARGRGLVAWK